MHLESIMFYIICVHLELVAWIKSLRHTRVWLVGLVDRRIGFSSLGI